MIPSELVGYYTRRAPEYEQIYARPERQAELWVLRRETAALLRGQRVLELACGTGYWTAILARAARFVLATDLSVATLAEARGKGLPPGRVALAVLDAAKLDGVGGAFSAAFAGFWWSHVPRQELRGFLAGLHQRLEPRARVLFLDNRHVPGSSTPIAERDARGNTYQLRQLGDGSTHRVLKNFPTAEELRDWLPPLAREVEVVERTYFWSLCYQLP